jgi:predicted transcriptional regulator
MESNELIRHLAGSAGDTDDAETVRLLRELQSEPASPAVLSDRCAVARSSVYRLLDPLVDGGLITRGDATLELTGGGHLLVRDYDWATERLGNDAVAFLAGSHHRQRTLQAVGAAPQHLHALTEEYGSRSTVRRSIRGCEAREWVRQIDEGRYTATAEGRRALVTYQTLAETATQVQAKAPFLQRFGSRSMDLPRGVLNDAGLVASTAEEPHAVLNAVIDLAGLRQARQGDGTLDHVRTVCPIFSPVMYDIFGSFVDSGTRMELVFDIESYREMCSPSHAHYLAGAVIAPNLDLRIYPEVLTFGIGYYDGAAMVAAYADREDNDAGVISEASPFVDWVNDTFDDLWVQSNSPTRHMIEQIRGYLDDDQLRRDLDRDA